MMVECLHCGQSFDPQNLPETPEVQVGLLLSQERFNDEGKVCADCLASRGRLAMMYDCQFRR